MHAFGAVGTAVTVCTRGGIKPPVPAMICNKCLKEWADLPQEYIIKKLT